MLVALLRPVHNRVTAVTRVERNGGGRQPGPCSPSPCNRFYQGAEKHHGPQADGIPAGPTAHRDGRRRPPPGRALPGATEWTGHCPSRPLHAYPLPGRSIRNGSQRTPSFTDTAAPKADVAANTPGMEIRLRDYRISPGHMDDWIAGWEDGVAPLRERTGVQLLGAWVDRPHDRFVWVRWLLRAGRLQSGGGAVPRFTGTTLATPGPFRFCRDGNLGHGRESSVVERGGPAAPPCRLLARPSWAAARSSPSHRVHRYSQEHPWGRVVAGLSNGFAASVRSETRTQRHAAHSQTLHRCPW